MVVPKELLEKNSGAVDRCVTGGECYPSISYEPDRVEYLSWCAAAGSWGEPGGGRVVRTVTCFACSFFVV